MMTTTDNLRRAHADALAAENAALLALAQAQRDVLAAFAALTQARYQCEQATAERQAAYRAWMDATAAEAEATHAPAVPLVASAVAAVA